MGTLTRPTFNDLLLSELSTIIGKEIYDWLQDPSQDLGEVIEDTKKVLEYDHNSNGYEIAREFESRHYYSPDSQLVDICDNVYSEKYNLIRNAVIQWVKENNIKPELPIGSEVVVKYGRGNREGTITGYKEETAEYLVCIPSDGHTIDGTTRSIIKYENAILSPSKTPEQ